MTSAQRGLQIGLVAVAAGLSTTIALEIPALRRDSAEYQAASRVAVPGRAVPVDAFGAPDRKEAWLSEILARPLFSPARRPVEAGIRGLPRLTGIVVAGPQRVAIFAAPSGDHPIVAQAGAHVGAYEVRTIADDSVTVVGPGGATSIRPMFDVARAAAPQPARPPPGRPPTAR